MVSLRNPSVVCQGHAAFPGPPLHRRAKRGAAAAGYNRRLAGSMPGPGISHWSASPMRTEVHVHGSIFLCKGVRLSQVDQSMRPWLDYLDVDTIGDAHSLEREEPGISLRSEGARGQHLLDGRSRPQLPEPAHRSVPQSRTADGVRVRSRSHLLSRRRRRRVLPDVRRPEPEAIHEFRRQCVVEDVSGMLCAASRQSPKSSRWRAHQQALRCSRRDLPAERSGERRHVDGDSAAPEEQAFALTARSPRWRQARKRPAIRRPFLGRSSRLRGDRWLRVQLPLRVSPH